MKNKSTLVVLLLVLVFFNGVILSVSAQWVSQNSNTSDTIVSVSFADINYGFAISGSEFSPFSKILQTTDGGLNWNIQTSNSFFLCVCFIDINNGFMGCEDTIYKTTNAGLTWTAYPLGLGASNYVVNIYFFNSNVGFASVGNYGTNAMTMVYTANGGNTWMASSSPGIAAGAGNNNIFCTNATTCYTVGWNGQTPGIIKTTDGGITWNNIANPNADLAAVCFTSSTIGYAAGGGSSLQRIYKTTDSGNTWNLIYSANSNFISSMLFTSTNVGYAAGGVNTGGSTVLKTTDGGNTWNPMTTPTNLALLSMDFPDSSTGYAVGNSGTILKYVVPTGIEETNNNNGVFIFPNPATDMISITVNNRNITDFTLSIYNILGALVKSTILHQDREVDISDLNNGIYVVELKCQNWSDTKKLTIQK